MSSLRFYQMPSQSPACRAPSADGDEPRARWEQEGAQRSLTVTTYHEKDFLNYKPSLWLLGVLRGADGDKAFAHHSCFPARLCSLTRPVHSPKLKISLHGLPRMSRETSFARTLVPKRHSAEGHVAANHNAEHAGAVGMRVSSCHCVHPVSAETLRLTGDTARVLRIEMSPATPCRRWNSSRFKTE